MSIEVKRPKARSAGIWIGLMLGGLLSLLYLALVVVVGIIWDIGAFANNSRPISVSSLFSTATFVTFFGCLYGVLPALIIGPITGWLIAVVILQYRERLSRRAAYMIGASISMGIALMINIILRFLSLGQPDGTFVYFLLLGVPSILYILAGSYMGIRLYVGDI
jgi:uncharacterized membrane protein